MSELISGETDAKNIIYRKWLITISIGLVGALIVFIACLLAGIF